MATVIPHFDPVEIVSVSRQLRMDCETPVSLFMKLAKEKEYSFVLESAEHGQHSGRFSFIGWNPILHFSYRPCEVRLAGILKGCWTLDQPLEFLKSLMAKIQMTDQQAIPHARGGFVGHFGYDMVHLAEQIGEPKQQETPWIELILPGNLLVFDHLNHVVTLICHQQVLGSLSDARAKADRGQSEILQKIRSFTVANAMEKILACPISWDKWRTNLDRQSYCDLVLRAKRHILDGDIFQVVLSRAARREFHGDPFEIYRALRQLNPSPYMFYLRQGERHIVGGSPESLVTLDAGLLTTKPIAGTRPRGKDFISDAELERELLADQKELAEHLMLVDLGRNDLGRVSKPGSVMVPRFMQIERYSHVMHIVSVVQGRLLERLHPLDALLSVFPAGTLSGAPKIRAMQIIHDLEPESRGIYGGAIGFIDFSGNLDSCIAIRSAVIEHAEVRVQAGAGIVADSIPDLEFDETTHKMLSMVTAVERAIAYSTSP